MLNLSLVPYQSTAGLVMDSEIQIYIRPTDFKRISFTDGKSTFAISNRSFKKVIIKNTSGITFEQIHIGFFGCFIKEIEVEDIKSNNISIGFYGCLIGGKVKTPDLSHIEFVNCLVYRSLFLMEVKCVRINYAKDNLDTKRWRNLLENIGVRDWRDLLAQKQSYHIYDVKQIDFTSNLKHIGIKRKVNLNLSITYNSEVFDSGTFVENAYLRSLSLTGNPSGKIRIDNTKIESLYIYKFEPKAEVKLYNIQALKDKLEDTKIGIHNCDLNNFWFDNVYFDQFDRISFFRTKFSKSLFTSCVFPNDYKIFRKSVIQVDNIHYPNKKGPKPR